MMKKGIVFIKRMSFMGKIKRESQKESRGRGKNE